MDKKILCIIFTSLFGVLLVSSLVPVMAASSKKVPVVWAALNTETDDTEAKILYNPNGAVHVWGAVRTASTILRMDPDLSKPPLMGSVRVDLDYTNFTDGTTIQRYRKITLTYAAQPAQGIYNEGSFVGTLTWKADTSNVPATIELHGILQGSGGFDGYTLHLNKDPGELPNHWVLIR